MSCFFAHFFESGMCRTPETQAPFPWEGKGWDRGRKGRYILRPCWNKAQSSVKNKILLIYHKCNYKNKTKTT